MYVDPLVEKKAITWVAHSCIQGGSIKPLLRAGDRFLRFRIRSENNLKVTKIYAILSVYGENSITIKAYIAKM